LGTNWLDEPTADIPPEAETNTTTIVSEFNARGMTHEEIWLRYYADQADEKLLQSNDPNFVFPPHEEPPYDRDRFLPVPRFRSKLTPAGCPETILQIRVTRTTRTAWLTRTGKSPRPHLNAATTLR